ncbi:MAG: pyrroloquinoline quinone biosynthesis peptide chaperone PqqD [Saccharopolyspora sp.]|uniref:pyrroloquinoline quinone biosynthesis peptide chaperone PqqD n=1 Tax=unclassified Saccharopolyspora TaxID=2646250 RepID=UPI0025F50F9A|nr:pyrroloquinoline quinone biosynthesis peptide chaperone PqqD [Saccharopolyspora sp.]MBQ6643277.1 pyrroloquinoline quinone biosynthesis peptide chaperone PqqD [Saccharopolyspora sp.]
MPSTKPTPAEPARLPDSARPQLTTGLRLTFDEVRARDVLLGPESVLVLNPTGAAILRLCDGRRDIGELIAELQARFAGVEPGEVRAFLDQLAAKRCVEAAHDRHEA